jgi:ankyrin repeat protein
LETVRVLVGAGADRDAADDDGKTPLDEAREAGIPELRRILEHDAA